MKVGLFLVDLDPFNTEVAGEKFAVKPFVLGKARLDHGSKDQKIDKKSAHTAILAYFGPLCRCANPSRYPMNTVG